MCTSHLISPFLLNPKKKKNLFNRLIREFAAGVSHREKCYTVSLSVIWIRAQLLMYHPLKDTTKHNASL